MIQSEIEGRPMEVAKEVARLAREILGHGVEVTWFGSWPQGRAQPHSDIDMAVSAARPIPPEQFAVLRNAADDLPTLYSIELLDLASAGQSLRNEILRHGVRL